MGTQKNNSSSKRRASKPAPTEVDSEKFNSTTRPFLLILFAVLGALLAMALFDFNNQQDFFGSEGVLSSFAVNSPLSDENLTGKIGATISVLAFNYLGLSAFMLPVFLFLFAFYMARFRADISLKWKTLLMILTLCAGATLLEILPADLIGYDPEFGESAYMPSRTGPGGALGKNLFNNFFHPYVGTAGSALILTPIYFFCVLGLLVSAPQKTIARAVNAIVDAVKKHFENRRHLKDIQKRLRDAQAKAYSDAQARVLKNNETPDAPATENSADEKSSSENETLAPVNGEPENFSETETDSDDFSNVSVDDNAIPETTAPVLEKLEPGATLTPIDFETKNEDADAPENSSLEKTPDAPAGELKVVAAETLERADEGDVPATRGDYVFPPIDLLAEPKPGANDPAEDYQARGQEIIAALAQFDCPATLVSAKVGPTITRYEIKPGNGVRAGRILNLQSEVAMALRAKSARLAPVTENGTIGIEVPNRVAKSVPIREVLESKAWHENKMEIPAVLGKDVTGKPVLVDLAKMPHGLIAGSSGSGKSVCLNGIITSILYHASPEDVRLVMVDPKVVELKVYNDAPHMLIPVITDMKRAPGALKWLIAEMERRYLLLEEAGVRNIVGYNAKIEKDKAEAARLAELAANSENTNAFAGAQENVAAPAAESVPENISVPRDEGVLDELRGKKKMAYIVCIIDEFADIMAQNAAEIETGVARLTAKARAAGIHLILATQRPDAKTVTGLIKANLGTRIALRVTSGTNSRIILDEVGAETLIGKGDMLVLGPGSPDPQRAQGVWVSEEEIENIVHFLAEKNGKPKYADDVTRAIDNYAAEGDESAGGDAAGASGDDIVAQAWEIIRASQKASISYIQRRLGIGYNRAANIIEELERQGKIGPDRGPNKPREIYE